MEKQDLIQREMIKREEIMNSFNTNYLLEAGAGAGKTTIIVERIINQLIHTDTEPANIVAITFTKAAATELAERIQLKALDYLQDVEDHRIRRKLESIDEIFTGTIHSFCDLMLREMPFEANITPGYEIVEEEADFHNKVWYDFIRNKEGDYKDKIDLLEKFSIDYRELRDGALVAMSNPDIDFVGYEDFNLTYAELEEEFYKIKKEYHKLNPSYIKRSPNLSKLLRAILEEDRSLDYFIEDIFKECPKYELDENTIYERIIYKKNLDNPNRQEYMDFISRVFHLYSTLNKLGYNTCTDFINMAVDYKEKNYRGKLTFNELLYKASQLIQNSSTARQHFKEKYKYFYIDEFQDTDPMQAELIFYLTDQENEGVRKSWVDCEPRAGSLFVVGDPKQSIYRFRRADITIYNQVKEILAQHGEVVYLDINFRSSDNICNWVQSTFKKEEGGFAFASKATDTQAGFEKILSLWDDEIIDKGQTYGRKRTNGIYYYDNTRIMDEDVQIDEAEYVANLVENIMESYYLVEKVRKSTIGIEENEFYNQVRLVEPKDFMILTKTNKETGVYLRALKDKGIPALLAGEKTLGDTREVLNLFILLDALVDYRDGIKVVAALRNCFYLDLATIDLFMEDIKDRSNILYTDIKIKHSKVEKAILYMREIASPMRRLSPITFIEKLIKNRFGIFNTDREYSTLEERDAESALAQTVENLKAAGCDSIYQVRDELERLVKEQVNYELPISTEYANNAIRVMNIHKAKGLEANIVILVGRDKKDNLGRDSHYVEKDMYGKILGYLVYKRDYKLLGPKEKENKERENLFKRAENERLLYVAATRAKTSLILAKSSDEKKYLYPLSQRVEEELVPTIKKVENQDIGLGKGKREELEETKELRDKKIILEPSFISLSPSDFVKGKLEEGNKYRVGLSPVFTSFKKENLKDRALGPRGSVFGTIIHRALEVLIKGSRSLGKVDKEIIEYATNISINESINKLEINKTNLNLLCADSKKVEEMLNTKDKFGSRPVREKIKKEIRPYLETILINFANNKEIKKLFKEARQIFTELPFSINVKDNVLTKLADFLNREEMKSFMAKDKLVTGVIDLVIQSEDNSWTIIDYKSDIITNENHHARLVKRYEGQLRAYKIFLEEILKEEKVQVDRLILYSTFKDQLIYLEEPALV